MSNTIAEQLTTTVSRLDVEAVRADFPVLRQQVNGRPLVYLDNAATTQKPRQVIETVNDYYRNYNSNVHRGVHTLSEKATAAYEDSRLKVKQFINAGSEKEIIFVRGATEGINLVAQSYGMTRLGSGDEIIISEMEHHSNIVPWQLLCERTGAVLKVIPINDAGELDMNAYERLLGPRTQLVSIVHISNALGTINPVKEIIEKAHAHDALVLVDGAQAAAHTAIDVRDLDCDFYVFSAHKFFGPTGIGVLYGKAGLLDAMPPYQSGGDMIKMVTLKKTLFNELPYKFEAGTPNIAGVIGMGAAIDYVSALGLDHIAAYEHELLDYATKAVSEIEGLELVGTAQHKTSILSFTLGSIHAHDIGTILDHEGIAVRAGHHCAMPVMERFSIPATARASFALYNTRDEADSLVRALHKCREIFG